MKIYIHYQKTASAGYAPREPLMLNNVESVSDQGVGMVRVRMQFGDARITHDHVTRVVIEPDTEELP
jgi:hypothetical protein